LLHGDINGLLSVPVEALDSVVEEVGKVREAEAKILELARSPDFSVQALKDLQSRFRH
jgi:hypothetical protein